MPTALSSTSFSMAIHLLTLLALAQGELVASSELAEQIGTNPSFLRQLVGKLRDAGLVETKLGKGGGTRLVKDAVTVRLLDIYRATETALLMAQHDCSADAPCPVERGMRETFASLNHRIERAVERELASTTLAEIIEHQLSERS
ncbi:MAG: Rrf2 family transcriptional regulator [Nannocystaceae bacterium]|nr:Rrf2 family transcriptional regulator [Nannocystaceae bacterium]